MTSVTTPPSIYPAGFPFKPGFAAISGYRIAYFDTGRGEKTMLMVHGNPVSAYVYARLMQRLSPQYRCVVPDLLGFGLSAKPADESDYSLSKHIDIMAEFVRTLDLRNTVLVAHDWGGPIGFGAAVQEKERYSHLVVLNTMTEAPMKIRPIYWLPFHVLLPMKSLYGYLVKERNLFQKLGVSIMEAADQAVYFRANYNAATRAGIAAFPRMIPYRQKHPNYPILRHILAELEAWLQAGVRDHCDIDELRGQLFSIEGRAAQKYWQGLGLVLPQELKWPGRKGRGARDPFNSALNYGYGILYAQTERALVLAGLDPYGGYIHVDRPGKPSLVLYFIEPFRAPVVDRTILGLANKRVTFAQDERGMLTEETRRQLAQRVLQRLESGERFSGKRYPLRVILQMQARHLATYLRGERQAFRAFVASW
jgi:pimeloyl-ACP methyl ester carboxylesterase